VCLRSRYLIALVFGLMLSTVRASAQPASAAGEAWTIDPNHTSANFAVKHMLVSTVRGKLGKVTGTITWDGKDVRTIQTDVSIDVAGLNTGVERRDHDLRGESFFDVAKYPTITFRSTRVIPGAGGTFKLAGDLTMHGTTREVLLDVEGPSPPQKMGGNDRTGATATGTINRREFGLLYNKVLETGGAVVADEVQMTIDIEATRPAAAASNPND
jgi:polyisoprenoid-binding protein YceI